MSTATVRATFVFQFLPGYMLWNPLFKGSESLWQQGSFAESCCVCQRRWASRTCCRWCCWWMITISCDMELCLPPGWCFKFAKGCVPISTVFGWPSVPSVSPPPPTESEARNIFPKGRSKLDVAKHFASVVQPVPSRATTSMSQAGSMLSLAALRFCLKGFLFKTPRPQWFNDCYTRGCAMLFLTALCLETTCVIKPFSRLETATIFFGDSLSEHAFCDVPRNFHTSACGDRLSRENGRKEWACQASSYRKEW